MNLLYVMDCKIDQIGGSQKSTITIANEMLNYYNISMICEEPNNIEFDFFSKKIKFYFFTKKKNKYINLINKMFFLKKNIQNNNYNIIHVQNTRFFVITAFALKFKIINKRKIKFVYTDRDFYDAYTPIYKFLIKKLASTFDTIICTTPMNKKLWENFHDDVKLISNALEDEWFLFDEKRKKNNDNLVIGFCGRFVEYKRWDNVLKICEKLKNKFKFSFVVSLSNKEEIEDFKKYKKSLDNILGENYLLKINANTKEIEDFYYNIDIFILTSEKESFGRTLIEAMTKYNVVFGTNSGGVPYVIKDKDFLYEVNNLEELYNKINNLIISKENLYDKKKYFYTYAKENFHANIMFDKYNQLYKR